MSDAAGGAPRKGEGPSEGRPALLQSLVWEGPTTAKSNVSCGMP